MQYEEMLKSKKSITGRYLSGEKDVSFPPLEMVINKGIIELQGATQFNLKNVNPSQLVDADIRMWQRIKEAPDRIALEEFRAYEQDVRLSRSESRNAFRAFLAERLTPPMMARGLNKDKKN